MTEGEALRDIGMERVLSAEDVEPWRDRAYAWIERLPRGAHFTSSSVIENVGMPERPNAVGAVMRAEAVQGNIANTGTYVKSIRPSCHAAIIAVWERL